MKRKGKEKLISENQNESKIFRVECRNSKRSNKDKEVIQNKGSLRILKSRETN